MSTSAARASIAMVVALASAIAATAPRPARAEIDGDTLVDAVRGVRLQLPRGWRTSDVTPYPGVLAWMSRTTPRVSILVTADRVEACSEPRRFCERDATRAVSALRLQLEAAGFTITAQALSRTPEVEYEAGRRYLRQAVVVVGDQVVSVVLAADSPSVRAGQGRVFERLVASVRSSTPPRPGTTTDAPLAPPPVSADAP